MTIPRGRRLLADLALVGVAFIWGSTFVVVKKALEDCSTLLFLALRFTLAAVVLGVVFRRGASLHPFRKGVPRAGLLVGCALFLGYLLQTLGLRLTTPARSGLITGFAVVLVPVFGAALYRVWPSWNSWAGVGCATAGLWLLMAPRGEWIVSAGDVLTLLCAAAFGLHLLLLGHYSPRVGAPALATAQVGVAAALSAGTWFWVEQPYVRWTTPLVAAVFVTGLLATALAFSVQTWAQQFTSPTHTALILTLEPVFAWLTSYVVMGEVLGTRAAAGAVLILAGIVVSELKPS